MSSHWQPRKLNELAFVGRGKSRHRPRNSPELYGGPYPFVQTADIAASEFYIRGYTKTYSELGLAQSKLWNKPTLCMTIAGENTAKNAILKFPACFPDSIVGIIPYEDKADIRFLKYILDTLWASFRSVTKGATQDNLSLDKLLSFDIPTPPLPTQRRIAAILSAYDDLIENNTHRIAILEEMARRLYEEWFVHFRFPGHEGVKMVDSEVGEVPEGWACLPLDAMTTFISRGIAPKYDGNADCRVINQKCIRDQRLNMALARRQSKRVPDGKLVQLWDVLINSTGVGTLGRVAQVCEHLDNSTVDSHVTIVRRDQNIDPDFFGLALFYLQPHFEGQGIGATGQTELGRARIGEVRIVVPPAAYQKRLGDVIRPLRSLCMTLLRKNTNLRTQRDLLLPKLISGEIDVSQLEEPSLESAA